MNANVLDRPKVLARRGSATSRSTISSTTVTPRQLTRPTPLIAIEHEPAPRLVVDPPLAHALSEGRVYIQYRTENIRILPVFGAGALDVSPRIGHLHVTVDAEPWHFVDASGETIVLVGLPPGPHKVLIELADPTHRVIAAETVNFSVPATASRGAREAPTLSESALNPQPEGGR